MLVIFWIQTISFQFTLLKGKHVFVLIDIDFDAV